MTASIRQHDLVESLVEEFLDRQHRGEYPTIVLFSKDGRELGRVSGWVPAARLLALFRKAAKRR